MKFSVRPLSATPAKNFYEELKPVNSARFELKGASKTLFLFGSQPDDISCGPNALDTNMNGPFRRPSCTGTAD
jgi:hypothetical protein